MIGRLAAVLLCTTALAACDSGGAEAKTDHPCEIASGSQEQTLLRDILRTDGFQPFIMSSTSRATERLEQRLRMTVAKESAFPLAVCAYRPDGHAYRPAGQTGVERASFEFGWVDRTSPDVKPHLDQGVPFEANGSFGEANAFITKLYVECALPRLGDLTKTVWLYTESSFTVNIGRTDIDQAARDRQTALTYLMTRRITDALGCENKPLEQPPTVKPLPAPTP
ncbi:hypothetical protein SUDANB120_02259 [Streptomyces sp. enrichment culture]|uniref:hypothetical protein n=1 Tax=Streptomyces sp. enrichment culture TaxID=1795815 RepID=UPI003F544C9B